MKRFAEVFREERHYCSHLFRLLLENKERDPLNSGLYKVLDHLGLVDGLTEESIRSAEVYFEAAAFRDVYYESEDKEELLESLYDSLLRLLGDEYDLSSDPPPRPKEILVDEKSVHPRLLFGIAEDKGLNRTGVFFYRELSALFSAKPDLLIVLPSTTLWIEAKFWESFESEQIERTKRIAALSETKLFQDFFGGKRGKLVLLGSDKRHKKAKKLADFFLSWEVCSKVADEILPENDDTRDALTRMLSMK